MYSKNSQLYFFKNLSKMKSVFFTFTMLLFLFTSCGKQSSDYKSLKAQNDSIRIILQGDFIRNEKFNIFYKDTLVKTIKCKKHHVYFFAIKKDSIIKENDILDIRVLRKGAFGLFYRDTYFGTTYKSEKYLILYKNEKLKNRFSIEPIWQNEQIWYR